MTLADVPIWLINMALVALVSLPVVVVACALYVVGRLGRPAWALYRFQRDLAKSRPAPAQVAIPPVPNAPVAPAVAPSTPAPVTSQPAAAATPPAPVPTAAAAAPEVAPAPVAAAASSQSAPEPPAPPEPVRHLEPTMSEEEREAFRLRMRNLTLGR